VDAGLTVNGIPVSPEAVIFAETRVDISDGTSTALLVEHPLALTAIFGIQDVAISGTRVEWDFSRASDKDARAKGLTPAAIVGLSDGSIGADVADQIREMNLVTSDESLQLATVSEPVEYTAGEGNHARLEPNEDPDVGLEISVSLFSMKPVRAILHPEGLLDENGDPGIRFKVLQARTPAVIGLQEEASYHALGDVCADIAALGGIRCGRLEVSLARRYHAVTIGLVRTILDQGLLQLVSN
jgi:hypothetical protein